MNSLPGALMSAATAYHNGRLFHSTAVGLVLALSSVTMCCLIVS